MMTLVLIIKQVWLCVLSTCSACDVKSRTAGVEPLITQTVKICLGLYHNLSTVYIGWVSRFSVWLKLRSVDYYWRLWQLYVTRYAVASVSIYALIFTRRKRSKMSPHSHGMQTGLGAFCRLKQLLVDWWVYIPLVSVSQLNDWLECNLISRLS